VVSLDPSDDRRAMSRHGAESDLHLRSTDHDQSQWLARVVPTEVPVNGARQIASLLLSHRFGAAGGSGNGEALVRDVDQ
jgi:hypothetical protein